MGEPVIRPLRNGLVDNLLVLTTMVLMHKWQDVLVALLLLDPLILTVSHGCRVRFY